MKPSGARSWIFRATINGKRREIGLDGHPVVSLTEARDAAILDRIEAGTFGTCAAWGELISEERLEAVPCAALCRDCS